MQRFSRIVGGALVALGAGAAHAGPLTGQTLGGSGPGLTPALAIVGSGVEFNTLIGLAFNFDVDGKLTIFNANTENVAVGNNASYTFTDTGGGIDDIVGLTPTGATGVAGATATERFYTANSMTIDLSNTNWAVGSLFRISIAFAAPAEVPEPGSLAIVGVALAGLALRRRRTPA